jgi:hypothetical protein
MLRQKEAEPAVSKEEVRASMKKYCQGTLSQLDQIMKKFK